MGDDGKTPLLTDSADAGLNLSLHNIFGSFLWNLSPRNFEQVIEYDRLQRKLRIQVKGIKNNGDIATDTLVETFTYGESQPQAEDWNLWGQLYYHQDQSGVITNSRYGLQGELLETTRQLTQSYKGYVNWDENIAMEPELYMTQFKFNALQQLISETTPDSSITTNSYNQAGLLERVTVQFKNDKVQSIIDAINYNANRQRTEIIYGNGVTTTYSYEDTTLHLIQLYSTRSKNPQNGNHSTVLQNITYTYDPVGNITRLTDCTQETVFYNNQMVEPVSDYTYNALYRLIEANGRQHPGIKAGTYRNNQQQEDFKQSKYIPLTDTQKLENYRETYTYDEAGNLIQTAHSATNFWTRRSEMMENSNRLKTVDAGLGVQTMEYDNSGNQKQLNLNSTVKLTWSCCETLSNVLLIERADNKPNDADYYTYDSNELRTRKVSERLINGGAVIEKEEKIYLGNYEIKRLKTENGTGETTILKRQTLRVMDDQTCVAILHYWEQDERQREVANHGTRSLRFQLDNHLGSVALEVDEDAQVISYEEYFPYGGTALIAGRNQQDVKLKEYRYSGKERDDSTGLYYYGARYYAPWLGRWISADPAGTVDGLNLFEFVGGNPVSHVDLTGEMKLSIIRPTHSDYGEARSTAAQAPQQQAPQSPAVAAAAAPEEESPARLTRSDISTETLGQIYRIMTENLKSDQATRVGVIFLDQTLKPLTRVFKNGLQQVNKLLKNKKLELETIKGEIHYQSEKKEILCAEPVGVINILYGKYQGFKPSYSVAYSRQHGWMNPCENRCAPMLAYLNIEGIKEIYLTKLFQSILTFISRPVTTSSINSPLPQASQSPAKTQAPKSEKEKHKPLAIGKTRPSSVGSGGKK
jgi:RHS repeat-associated protein